MLPIGSVGMVTPAIYVNSREGREWCRIAASAMSEHDYDLLVIGSGPAGQ